MVVPKLTQKFLGVICIRYYFENKTIRAAIRNKEDLAIREQQTKHVLFFRDGNIVGDKAKRRISKRG